MPAPDSVINCGLFDALSETVTDAVKLPRAAGVNVTLIVQVNPPPSVLGLMGQFPPKAKSLGLLPVVVMLPIVSGVDWVLVNVTFFVLLEAPSTTFPKGNDEGFSVTCATAGEPANRKDSNAKRAPQRSQIGREAAFRLRMAELQSAGFVHTNPDTLREFGLAFNDRGVK